MNYKDRWATDEEGNRFLFTVEMQRSLSEQGLPVEPASLSELSMNNSHNNNYRDQEPPRRNQRSDPAPQKEQSSGETFDEPLTVQIDPETGKYIGRMKWYNAKKGYGFLMRGGGEEIFFHKTNMTADPEQIQEGQWVLYDVEETKKGPEATDIEPYDGNVDMLMG